MGRERLRVWVCVDTDGTPHVGNPGNRANCFYTTVGHRQRCGFGYLELAMRPSRRVLERSE